MGTSGGSAATRRSDTSEHGRAGLGGTQNRDPTPPNRYPASATSAARPFEFLDDLAWALLYLGDERHRLGDLERAVAADERAVAPVRTVAEMGGTGLGGAPSQGGRGISQGGRDIVYLLSSLSFRYLAALEGYAWQEIAPHASATRRKAG